MSDPTSGYVATKIAAAIGGFFGGAGMMTFIKPKSISEAFIRGAISTGTAIIFAEPVLIMGHIEKASDWQFQLAAGAIIGFIAYSILGAIANFFIQNQKEDIVTLAKKVRGK